MPNKSKTILVTGATGHQGGAVVRHLRDRGFSVRALTRDPSKPAARQLAGHGTEVVRGDMEDFDSLRRALDGVHGVFAVSTPYEGGIEAEIREGKQLVDAAKRASINHFVYTSVGSADRSTGVPHFDSKYEIETHLRGTGLTYTILRPVFFMENWEQMRPQIEQGSFELPLGPETRLQMIAVSDIAAFATMAFEHPGKWKNREVDLAGDELSMSKTAETFGRVLGREVRYRQVPWDEFEKQSGREITTMYRWFEDKGYSADIGSLRSEYSRLMALEPWLRSHAWDRALAAH
jgi:uncharacterized protein YbjT (DUF2867 family)